MTFKKTILALTISLLAACGSDSSSSSKQNPDTPQQPSQPQAGNHQIIDPDAAADRKFGSHTVELTNGNIAIISGLETTNSAAHIYNPLTQQIIGSFYSDDDYDFYDTAKLTALTNGNLVLSVPDDKVNGVVKVGSVKLINGTTGAQIGSTISGDNASDYFGLNVKALSNGNFVIISIRDSVNGINSAGSITLVNGTTGAQIGSVLHGDNADDRMGLSGVFELTNGNFVVASAFDDIAGKTNAGSVTLVNGTTGSVIGSPIVGDRNFDNIGHSGIYPMDNGNYAIASQYDDVATPSGSFKSNAGTVILVNGTTGAQIGTTIEGEAANERLGRLGVIPLANNEFMVNSEKHTINGSSLTGSVGFYNADTGAQIGPTYSGSTDNEYLGNSTQPIQLSNGNIVIVSDRANSASNNNVGRFWLINGATKAEISTFSIDQAELYLGRQGVFDLKNGNFAVVSSAHNNNGLANVGSVMIFNGTTGAQVGSTIFGDNADDYLGTEGLTVLDNGNFVIASAFDDINGAINAGSVMLIDGATGTQIGTSITGSNTNDNLSNNGVFKLNGSNNYVVASSEVDVNGVSNAGSVILVNGDTGVKINIDTGNDTNDAYGRKGDYETLGVIPLANGNYLINATFDDDNGNQDVGTILYRLGQ